MRIFLSFIFLLVGAVVFSQETITEETFTEVDSLYREDQFYFGLTYDLLNNTDGLRQTPPYFSQNGFSVGLSAGFLRDMPINESRTVAIAAGFGLSYVKYHQNLVISEENGIRNYEVVDKYYISRNKLEQVFVDFPLEFRWRNSTPESYKFWRVYTGFKVRCLIFDKSKYVGNTVEKVFYNPDFNSLQYGPYISLGHNTINLHMYYGLSKIFKSSANIQGKPIDLSTLNFGLMFYIL